MFQNVGDVTVGLRERRKRWSLDARRFSSRLLQRRPLPSSRAVRGRCRAAARRGIRLGAALGQPRRRHMRRARFDDDVSGVDEACRGLRLGSARRDPHRSREHWAV